MPGGVFYLPSGRSGLITASPILGAAAIAVGAQQAGLQPIAIPPLPGVERDFLNNLTFGIPPDADLLLRPDWTQELDSALQLLENLMGGNVRKRAELGRQSVFYHQRDGLELRIEHSSSMVAETAAIALWIKAFLRSGDLLIIDEPEAHLHPKYQRLMARVLVRLMNAGVRVICTTHSSLIVHQLSNCIVAGRMSSEERGLDQFADVDLLNLDDVAAYVFDETNEGTVASPVDIDELDGISEDEFIKVSEAIGEESYLLALRADRARALANA
jgi:hypothetical protein